MRPRFRRKMRSISTAAERRPGDAPIEPLYRVSRCRRRAQAIQDACRTDRKRIWATACRFTFFDAGHILGSAYVVLEWTESGKPRTLLFTADVGRYDTPILRDPHADPGPGRSGHHRKHLRQHLARRRWNKSSRNFSTACKYCIARKSRLDRPVLRGRAARRRCSGTCRSSSSEKKIPPIPIFVDSPMGVEVSKVHTRISRQLRRGDQRQRSASDDLFGRQRRSRSRRRRDQSKAINSQRGAVRDHRQQPDVRVRPDPASPQAERGTRRTTWSSSSAGSRRTRWAGDCRTAKSACRIFDRWYDVRCQVRTIHGLSAHADGDELLKFLKPTLQSSTRFYVVHGEVAQAEGFAVRLQGPAPVQSRSPPWKPAALIV